MKKTVKVVLCALFYLCGYLYCYSGMFGYFQGEFRNSLIDNYETCREDQSFSAGLSLIPFAWAVETFTTGFNQYGHQWTCNRDFPRR